MVHDRSHRFSIGPWRAFRDILKRKEVRNDMPCVRKRRGKWVIDFYDQFGKRHWETIGNNKKDAQTELAGRIDKVDKETYRPKNKKKTFGEVAEEWYQTLVLPNKRIKTVRYYRNMLDNHLLPYFSGIKLGRIDLSSIEGFMFTRLKENRIAKSSINKSVTTLGTILKYAVRHNLIDSNPVANVQKLRISSEEMVEDKMFFTPEEIHLLLDNADPKYGPLLLTAVMTGMREGELLGLQWDDVDWHSKQIYVRRTLQIGRFYEPKTRASKRRIDVDAELLSELKKWKLRCPKGELNLVFPNEAGKPMDATNMIKRIWYPTLRKAGLPRGRFHLLRHTNASLRIEAGQNIKYNQSQLGHSSIQITLDIYGHLMKPVNNEEAVKLRATLFGSKNEATGSKMVAGSLIGRSIDENANATI
jgi:integrase